MAAPELYLARHGQTSYNVEERMGGNSDLTLKGIAQAEKVADILKCVEFTEIYCSTLIRSIHTAEIICRHHPDTRLVKRPDLIEILNGDLDNVTYPEFKRDFPELFRARGNDKYHWQFPNGESYESMTARIRPFLDNLKAKEGNFLIVGHNGLNRAIIGYICDLDKKEIPVLNLPHDVVFEISLANRNIFHIKEGQKIRGYKA